VRSHVLNALILGSVASFGWAADDAGTKPPEPDAVAAEVKQILRNRCHDCHGGTSTQGGLVILDRASLLAASAVVPGRPAQSSLLDRVTSGDDSIVMPEAPLPRLAAHEIDAIRRWIELGAAPFPADVPATATAEGTTMASLEGIYATILSDVDKTPRADRRFRRYFSLVHLVAEGTTPENLALQRDALAKAVNHLSRRRQLVRPTVVDEPTGGVLAVDIRDLGWDARPFDSTATAERFRDLTLWDLALLDYPYGVAMPGNETFDRLAEAYLEPAGMVRPVAFVRADWFVSVATQPPLYEDFLRLPRTAAEMERELGVPSLDSGRRGGVTISGVSQNNRVVERHRSDDGAYWLSVDFQSSKGRENMFRDPVNLSGSGGEYIFSLPNGLQGYFLADATGARLAEAPTSIVTDSFAEDRVVRNGLACMRCHDRGMKRFVDVVRPSLEKLSTSAVFDLRRALELYPPHAEMNRLLDEDTERFMRAMREVLGHDQAAEPLSAASRQFLEEPVSLTRATAEMGLPSPATLRELSAIPHFAALGMVPLATGGHVRRDMWEDFFDEITRQIGAATPMVPLDGLLRGDYPTARPPVDVVLTTDRPGNLLRVGEMAKLIVENRSDRPVEIEVIGTATDGTKTILDAFPATLGPRKSASVDLDVKPGTGRETVTLFAAAGRLPRGAVLRGRNVLDRVVRDLYVLEGDGGRSRIDADTGTLGIVKRSIALETR